MIKNKPYQTNDFQPQFYEKLPNNKKIQLITGMKIPQNLKKSTMKAKHIIG